MFLLESYESAALFRLPPGGQVKNETGVAFSHTAMSPRADYYADLAHRRLLLHADRYSLPAGVIMKRKQVKGQASAYALAGIFFSMLLTFIAYDLDAVRREASIQDEDNCSKVALRSCHGHAASPIHGVQGLLIALAE